MKKIKDILLVIFMIAMMVPFHVNAEVEKPEANKEPVKVYFFHGNGCPHCEDATKWFDSIKEEYGDYFDLVSYEVWYNEENKSLMQEVSQFKGDNATGVPYILVGKYSYPNGFGADSMVSETQTMGEQLIERILEIYQSDNRYDVMVALNDKPDYSTIVGIGALVIIIGLGAVAVISRRQNS